MKRVSLFALFVVTFFGSGAALPSFPGAEGWGAETPGGRGGKVYMVTNLNASGPGSLRDGILMREPRIIVFRVSGVIPLLINVADLAEANSFMTIAGQTSPGGITIYRPGSYPWHSYGVNVHDFVWRHLRFRTEKGGDDGIQFGPSHHFVLDHCDFSGGDDETTDLFYCYYFTMQWCTIANSETPTSKGTIVAGRGDHITFHHNIWAHHMERTPGIYLDQVPPDNGLIDIRNNLIYDINGYSTIITGTCYVNIVGNVWKQGPNTLAAHIAWTPYFNQPLQVYDEGNCFYEKDGSVYGCDTVLQRRYGPANRVATPWPTPPVVTSSAAKAYEDVLRYGGAIPKDSMNRRIERDVRTGTGAMLLIGDPKITSGPLPPADADMDGMPDCWENAMGFNPNDASDHNGDKDGDGYTNIEEYINDLALTLTGDPVHNVPLQSGCPTAVETALAAPSRSLATLAFFSNPAPSGRPIPFKLEGPARTFFNGSLQVSDILGRTVMNKAPTQTGAFPALAPGLYMVRWMADGSVLAATKLVVF